MKYAPVDKQTGKALSNWGMEMQAQAYVDQHPETIVMSEEQWNAHQAKGGGPVQEQTPTDKKPKGDPAVTGKIHDAAKDLTAGVGATAGKIANMTAGINARDPGSAAIEGVRDMEAEHGGQQRALGEAEYARGNRNVNAEASERAATQAAAQNAQEVRNKGAAAGGGAAALLRKTVAPDVGTVKGENAARRDQGIAEQKEGMRVQEHAQGLQVDIDRGDYAAGKTMQKEAKAQQIAEGKPEPEGGDAEPNAGDVGAGEAPASTVGSAEPEGGDAEPNAGDVGAGEAPSSTVGSAEPDDKPKTTEEQEQQEMRDARVTGIMEDDAKKLDQTDPEKAAKYRADPIWDDLRNATKDTWDAEKKRVIDHVKSTYGLSIGIGSYEKGTASTRGTMESVPKPQTTPESKTEGQGLGTGDGSDRRIKNLSKAKIDKILSDRRVKNLKAGIMQRAGWGSV